MPLPSGSSGFDLEAARANVWWDTAEEKSTAMERGEPRVKVLQSPPPIRRPRTIQRVNYAGPTLGPEEMASQRQGITLATSNIHITDILKYEKVKTKQCYKN